MIGLLDNSAIKRRVSWTELGWYLMPRECGWNIEASVAHLMDLMNIVIIQCKEDSVKEAIH